MKVSVLTPDLSHNCLGRAWVLAKILQNNYDVEILGPIYGDGIWAPMRDIKDIPLLELIKPTSRNKSEFKADIREKVNGDLIYASKPIYTSYGVGLIAKKQHNIPLILDIDDWQMGFLKGMIQPLNLVKKIVFLFRSLFSYYDPSNFWNNYFHEKRFTKADAITVSNTFLQQKFGGTLIPHCRDPDELDPSKFTGQVIRKKYNLMGKKIVSFIGTPNKYKGIEDVIEALSLIEDEDLYFMLVGMKDSHFNNFIKNLAEEKLGKRFIPLPLQPFALLPELLAASNITVIPQQKRLETIGQIPAKIFDAMAMEKPIVATAVNDIPAILDNAGWVVQPGNVIELKEAIEDAFSHPKKAKDFGKNARQRCIEDYSFSALEKRIVPIVKDLLQ